MTIFLAGLTTVGALFAFGFGGADVGPGIAGAKSGELRSKKAKPLIVHVGQHPGNEQCGCKKPNRRPGRGR